MAIKPHIFEAALAGMLHDIGKFSLRAGNRGSRTWDEEAARDFGRYHALLTADFIQGYIHLEQKVAVKNAASNHHRPTQRLDKIIALADHLSAGERADVSDDQRATQPRQLLKIFCDLSPFEVISGQRTQVPPKQLVYWPLETLRLEAKVLLENPTYAEDDTWKQYEKLWDEFAHAASALQAVGQQTEQPDLETYLESWLLLLQRYTWCIPSAYYKTRPDISLYDHLRMTAALAAILADSDLPETGLDALLREPQKSAETIAVLVGGDLSGVQDFIYTITNQGATSALRGRSFYLQLLTEAAARYLLRRLELPITNLVYAGGGNFYLLARPADLDRLAEIQAEISRHLLRHHHGKLYLAIAGQPLAAQDFFAGRISRKWQELVEHLQTVKNRRFAELQAAEMQLLFRSQGHGGNEEEQCQVCGQEHPLTKTFRKEGSEEGVRKCPPCLGYEDLGDRLRRARYLVWEMLELVPPAPLQELGESGQWTEVLAGLGFKARVYDDLPDKISGATQPLLILALDDQGLARLKPGPKTAVGRRLLVNVTPLIKPADLENLRAASPQLSEGQIKPFDMLERQSSGIERLGILRMDVDNLGELFAHALGEKATLSRIASLSLAISIFFEGWVAELARQRNQRFGERLYSIYSGGDDLFFVGSWDQIVELGREIRNDLQRYTGDHPGIHASAGIALVSGKYPLAQAAADAGQAENQAKGLKWWNGSDQQKQKDAICFLGLALPWQKFGLSDCTEEGIQNAHALTHYLIDEKRLERRVAMPLVRRLIRLHDLYQEAEKKRQEKGADQNRLRQPQPLFGPWNWLSVYALARLAKQSKSPQVLELRQLLKESDFRSIEWIGLAARWAELLLR